MIRDRPKLKVECVENIDAIFHRQTDERITLIDVLYVLDLGFNLYSLNAVQRTHLRVSAASGTDVIDTNMTSPRSSESYLRATRLLAAIVDPRKIHRDMRATNLKGQLRHPIPPPPQEIISPLKHVRDWYV